VEKGNESDRQDSGGAVVDLRNEKTSPISRGTRTILYHNAAGAYFRKLCGYWFQAKNGKDAKSGESYLESRRGNRLLKA